ncbi:MAG: HlyD family efflux transporter periplasmic adaptor subunit, partial [Desulfobacterales bacterium]
AGEVLFRIDDRDYRASLAEAQAAVDQWTQNVIRLNKQLTINRERLKTLERSRELARGEFSRLRQLYEVDQVGTRSGVEAAERSYNAAADLAAQMAQDNELVPVRIREAESSLAAARARMDMAVVRLERCAVAAPFVGRVREVNLEVGQYVSPGHNALTLADDSELEIHVSLDSRDARRWLAFDSRQHQETAWFGKVSPLDCRVRWTEAPTTHFWRGRLDRIVRFDPQTRTVTLAVNISAEDALRGGNGNLPLVEGMFCVVEIPGRRLDGVFRVPRHAVSFEGTVYVAREDRLRTLAVEVARIDGEDALISGGLSEGDRVVVTRLVDPLENSLLIIEDSHDSKGEASG